ncbi:hypothetical protein D9599_27665 [Roseomonas sp. KE2513]|uniref:hypothetical protein n=1 Tax=Roseomonas sp. KE2513 TaxID=2479202 RepID=UPI0018DF3565|nr:hypothetical protein [Roseomonas sp. KE2513]MBI0539308.1 hypothetical protein [Roseomonas sp. KE2513]
MRPPRAGPTERPLPRPWLPTSPPPRAPAAAETLPLHTSLLDDLTVPGPAEQAATLRALSARAAVNVSRARSEGTRRAYRSAWNAYEAWCSSLGRQPMAGDPETLAMYAVRGAVRSLVVSSLRVHLAAIQAAHRLAGVALDLRHPRLVMVLEGIARDKGTRPRQKAATAGPDVLRLMLAIRPSPATPLDARDRALLFIGFGAALCRSEFAVLRLGPVTPKRGLRVLVRRSKTDQRGAGQEVAGLANPKQPGFCPMSALKAWLVFRQRGLDIRGGASDAESALFVGMS